MDLRTGPWRWIAPLAGLVFAFTFSTACSSSGSSETRGRNPPPLLPPDARASLARALDESRGQATNVWRDTAPVNADGTVTAYVEIPRGERTKWEFDIGLGRRRVDREMPADLGGYPVNYGFVPQTISYDGDPFDALVLGPPLEGAALVRGRAVGLLIMEDEKGHDAKVVLTPLGPGGRPLHELSAADRERIGGFFDIYKRHEPGKFSEVTGWGDAAEGLAYVEITHQFFQRCREALAAPCEAAR